MNQKSKIRDSKIKQQSKIRQSKIGNVTTSQIIKKEQFKEKEQDIKKIKYPIKPISKVQVFKNKIQSFHQQSIKEELKKLTNEYNAYRQVRGDGNCFFRALAYSYLSSLKTQQIDQCFPRLNAIDLTLCKQQSIPKQFLPYYDDRLLKIILENNWAKQLRFIMSKYPNNYNRGLAKLLSLYPYLDFIVILYFRSLCYQGFVNYKDQLKQFLKGTEQQQILTYSEESQGVILDICSRILRVQILVYEIRKKQVIPYKYNKMIKSNMKITLLFYENHYDVIEKNKQEDMDKQRLEKDLEEQYYTEVNEKLIEGVCIECNESKDIYEENGLCIRCYQVSRTNLETYKKDKLKSGRCVQCYDYKNDISQTYGLCQRCIRNQNLYTTKNYLCQMCDQRIYEPGKCAKCEQISKKQESQKPKYKRGKCVQCGDYQTLELQLGMCNYCIHYQKKYSERIIELTNKKKKCSKCNEEIDPKDYNLHACKIKEELRCVQCNRKSQFLSTAKLCKDCAQRQQKTKNKQLPTYSAMACEKCKSFKMTLLDGICQSCRKQVFYRCKKCNFLKQTALVNGICKGCRQSPRIQKCRTCNRDSSNYAIVEGRCSTCRIGYYH